MDGFFVSVVDDLFLRCLLTFEGGVGVVPVLVGRDEATVFTRTAALEAKGELVKIGFETVALKARGCGGKRI